MLREFPLVDVLEFFGISEKEMLVGVVELRVCEENCGSVDEKSGYGAGAGKYS